MAEELTLEELEQPQEETSQEALLETPPETPPQEAPPEQKTVPLQALHEARAELRQLRERLSGVEQVAQNTELLRQQIEQMRAEKAQQAIPKYEEDPFGHTQYKLKEHEAKMQELEQMRYQTLAQQKQQEFIANVSNITSQHEAQFAQQHPDYNEAVQYLTQKRMKELESVGVIDPNAMAQHIQNSAFSFVTSALRNGKNPAEAAYTLAKEWGWQPKLQQTTSDLATVQQGMNVSKSISKGGVTETNPSVEALLNAEGDDFHQLWNKFFQVKK